MIRIALSWAAVITGPMLPVVSKAKMMSPLAGVRGSTTLN
ncbi:MAG: hypothetical protein MAG451_02001 [Anaerolineales bacterium]|nr:hypothetical protein [Anaerolineales bacterium]